MLRLIASAQGAYYLLTGIWPLLDIESFMAVAGPKTDIWFVHTVGTRVSVIVIGAVLLFAAVGRQLTAPVILFAVGSAAGLTAIEFFYAMRGEIWPVYLLDAVGESILLWAVGLFRERTSHHGVGQTASGWSRSRG